MTEQTAVEIANKLKRLVFNYEYLAIQQTEEGEEPPFSLASYWHGINQLVQRGEIEKVKEIQAYHDNYYTLIVQRRRNEEKLFAGAFLYEFGWASVGYGEPRFDYSENGVAITYPFATTLDEEEQLLMGITEPRFALHMSFQRRDDNA